MPTISNWTHVSWIERRPDESTSEKPCLMWFIRAGEDSNGPCLGKGKPYPGYPSCLGAAGCAWEDAVTLRESYRWAEGYIIPYPEEVLVDTMLHEAVHALYGAEHTNSGLMCNERKCYTGRVSVKGWEWPYRILRTLDHELYSLYGHPALKHGLTKAKAMSLVQVR